MATNTFGQDITQAGGSVIPQPTPTATTPLSTGAFTQSSPIDASILSNGSQLNLPSYTPPAAPTITPPPPIDFGVATKQGAVDTTQADLNAAETEQGNEAATRSQLETAQGVPDINNTLNELYAKDANYGADLSNLDSTELQSDLKSEDRFAPTTAINGEQAQAARQKAFQAQSINIQRATNSAAITAAQGRLSLANDYITKALDAQFTPLASKIDYLKTVLTQNEGNLSDAEKEQLQYQITQQQNALDQQKQDKTDIYNVLLASAQNGADALTLHNIQQATSPQDAIAAAGSALTKQNTATVNANGHVLLIDQNTGKTIADLGASDAALSLAAQHQSDPAQLVPYLKTTNSGVQYVDVSTLSAADRNKIAQIAGQNGIKVITNTNEAADLTNISNAYNNLDTMQTTFAGLTSPSPTSRIFNNFGVNPVATFLQTDTQKTASTALNDAALDLLKSISGTQGFRGNTAAIDQIRDNLPTIYDTTDVANQKLANVRQLIQNREDAIVGTSASATGSAGSVQVQAPDGNTYAFPNQQAADAFKKAAGIQ